VAALGQRFPKTSRGFFMFSQHGKIANECGLV
jgi:hypothetical protein